MTIAKIQKQLKDFDRFARQSVQRNDPVASLQSKWEALFDKSMSAQSAKSFAHYYKKMASNKKRGGRRSLSQMRKTRKSQKMRKTLRMRGGAASVLSPATLDYQMVPGANIQMYGRFPVEADTDPATIRDMDVYFNSGMSRTCGTENSARQVPADMGSNKVGGTRKRRHRRSMKHTGGSLMESLQVHPYVSTAPPNLFQTAANAWSGNPASVPAPASPVQYTWTPSSHGTAGIIDPTGVTNIGSDFSKFASPPAWQTTH
jgi:hypothetical protein